MLELENPGKHCGNVTESNATQMCVHVVLLNHLNQS